MSGRNGHAIVLKAFTVRIIKRAEPMKGAVLDPSKPTEGCGGGGDSLDLWYGKKDLDANPPHWVPHAKSAEGNETGSLRFPYKVTASSPVQLEIDVSTRHCDCTWVGRLDWSDGATSGTSTLTDKGRPFRTTPTAGLPSYRWDGHTWRK
ncbi:hypothetical protein [Streptomyces sp. NPDC021212]|uniref:hypothetical protein n=1 Tax=Streptomyces sp. NPDC021212 TaxID=3365118 RepID=UPI00378F9580